MKPYERPTLLLANGTKASIRGDWFINPDGTLTLWPEGGEGIIILSPSAWLAIRRDA